MLDWLDVTNCSKFFGLFLLCYLLTKLIHTDSFNWDKYKKEITSTEYKTSQITN